MSGVGALYMFVGATFMVFADHVASEGRFSLLMVPICVAFIAAVNLEDKK